MTYKNILVTGGAGFIGSHICVSLKKAFPAARVTAFDNLHRPGSELNVPLLKDSGVDFVRGDVRHKEELERMDGTDLIIECSAEPSVLAGYQESPQYLLETNLDGMINALELARRNRADMVFLSTSRVYPMNVINGLCFKETATRFAPQTHQDVPGISAAGISENFPLTGARSLYGATKLSAELLFEEYIHAYGIKGVINRCGVVAGARQMGKVEQGVTALWVASHLWERPLSYIGFGGQGKQVRDILSADDLCDVVRIQVEDMSRFNGQVYNIGGGAENSVSLFELTELCRTLTGKHPDIGSEKATRPADIIYYISDTGKFSRETGWRPKKDVGTIVENIHSWFRENLKQLEPFFN